MHSKIAHFPIKQLATKDAVRVLVVDDHKPWRAIVRLLLNRSRIVGEAKDGVEALDLAATLQPDVVLLDIGMPGLDGFAAALHIRQLAPAAKIIFLTVAGDPALIERGFRVGALGYVLKTDAGGELEAAVAAVLRDRPFVSSGAVQDLRIQTSAVGLMRAQA